MVSLDDLLPFVPVEAANDFQLFALTAIYGYILFVAANLIGDGSELLLLVPAYADLVGSVVLPVLGAVPDGMMILFSGIGERELAQDQVAVGVGALAGSTVMLLTIAWFVGMLGGIVNLENGVPNYVGRPKLTNTGLSETGYKVSPKIAKNAKVMMVTSLLYFFVQGPWFLQPQDETVVATLAAKQGVSVMDFKAGFVNRPALMGLFACLLAFVYYLRLQSQADEDAASLTVVTDTRMSAIKAGYITLRGVMGAVLRKSDGTLLEVTEKERTEMRQLLKPFFEFYDVNRDMTLSRVEFGKVLCDLHEYVSAEKEEALFNSADLDRSGSIDFPEFVDLMIRFVKDSDQNPGAYGIGNGTSSKNPVSSFVRGNKSIAAAIALTPPKGERDQDGSRARTGNDVVGNSAITHSQIMKKINPPPEPHSGDEDASEDEDEMPDDLKDMTPEQQQLAIKIRSAYIMGLGTLLVLVFSDPAVDVLNELGVRTGIPAFYISFVLAPLASNASELVATFKYASKKTPNSMTIALSTLLGAGCMNNTFCLAIFFALIYFQRLVWNFSAEVFAILLVEWVVGLYALKSVHTAKDGYIIGSLFFICLGSVFVLNQIGIP